MAKTIPLTPGQVQALADLAGLIARVAALESDGGSSVDTLAAATGLSGADRTYLGQGAGVSAKDAFATLDQIKNFVLDGIGETAQDAIAALLAAGTGNVRPTYDDAANALSLNIDPAAISPVFSLPLTTSSPIAAAYAMVPGDAGRVASVATGAADITVTLLVSGIAVGTTVAVAKNDTGAGKVIVSDGTNALAWLMTQFDLVLFRWNGTAWRVVVKNLASVFRVFTANDTFAPIPLAASYDVECIGAGGGGGSGRRGAAGSVRTGGSGGGRGGVQRKRVPASLVTGPVALTVPAGPSGGAAVTTDSTDGNAGSLAADTTFGNLVKAGAGTQGSKGSTTVANGGTPGAGEGSMANVTGVGGSSPVGAAGNPSVADLAGPGGGGAPISSANGYFAGGRGERGSFASPTAVAFSTAGTAGSDTVAGGAGTSGGDVSDVTLQVGGAGGSGGGSGLGGGNGGNGGNPGGGGGGGGASLNGAPSGAGGAGGRGEIRVRVNFYN